MWRYWAAVGGLMGLLLAGFVAVESLGVKPLTDPTSMLAEATIASAVAGVALLVGDVVLPVPSSLVMIAHGALFGVVVGALLSLAGSVGAAMVGVGIGRRGGALLTRLVTDAQKARGDSLLHRWGLLAVVVTRPVPILAETVAILAGASKLPVAHVAMASAAGGLPAALLYALAGAVAATFGNATVVFGLVLAVAALMWLAGGWMGRRVARDRNFGRRPPNGKVPKRTEQ